MAQEPTFGFTGAAANDYQQEQTTTGGASSYQNQRPASSSTNGAGPPGRHTNRDGPSAEQNGRNRMGFDGTGGQQTCRRCLEPGHFARDCRKPVKCIRCKQDGHTSQDCTEPRKTEGKPGPSNYIPQTVADDKLFEYQIEVGGGLVSYINKVEEGTIDIQKSGIEVPEAIKNFDEADLHDQVKFNIKKHCGYEVPTPIQKIAIPIIMDGRDLMACAITGSGKTAAYALPIQSLMLSRGMCTEAAMPDLQEPVCLILVPTRELADQVHKECRKFSMGTVIQTVVVYGGTSVQHQREMLRRGCTLLVGTPGRIQQFYSEGYLSFRRCKFFVLDEADRMLDMGFEQNVRNMVQESGLPPKERRQTLMFSATFPTEIQRMAGDFLKNFIFVSIGDIGGANPDVEQTFVKMEESSNRILAEKKQTLLELLRSDLDKYNNGSGQYSLKTLVFVERKRNADYIASLLCQNDLFATSIHSDREQRQREEALAQFKDGKCPILVATAVAARGLDIKGVDHVINYDLPQTVDDYVHRIGRTGRVGNPGRATSFYDPHIDRDLATGLVEKLVQTEQGVPDWLDHEARNANATAQERRRFKDVVPAPPKKKMPSDEW